MKRSRDQFLAECTDTERATFERVFAAFAVLHTRLQVEQLGGAEVFFDFEDHICALMLRHPRLSTKPIRLVLGGSSATGREEMREAFSCQQPKLVQSGIPHEHAAAFAQDLESCEFEQREPGLWRTRTANTNRPDRLSSIFDREQNLAAFTGAVHRLVLRVINGKEAD